MRHSKRSLEGEAMFDHRNSPGMPEMGPFGPRKKGFEAGGFFESALNVCSHCQAGIILNPDRSRARGYCSKCDKYICDACAALMHLTLECRDIRRQIDQAQNELETTGSTLIALGRPSGGMAL